MEKGSGANLEFVREDDYVEYYVFPKLNRIDGNDENEREHNLRTRLEDLRKHCMNVAETLIKERQYIWHKDEFNLCVRTCAKQEMILNDESTTKEKSTNSKNSREGLLPPHLHGVTHYGDNIADEWFIVYLLTQLTKQYENIVVRVIDSDGEFLLIEAADVLPKWANPDTCEERVYLSNGVLHLVQNSSSLNMSKSISVATGVDKIQNNSTVYKVSKEIQDCIDERIKEFDGLENKSLHHQIVRLPLGVAVILRKQPSLIASAVRAFCERDPIDIKTCSSMRYFPPEQRVRCNVCFTKCLYAMIMHSNYVPDRKVGWNLSGNPNSTEYKEDLLGIKLACGFEILASQAKDGQDEENSAWKAYVRSLQDKGYFRENIEGSKDYQSLLEQAKQFFKDNQTRFRTAPLVGKEILELLRTTEINAEQLRDEENNLRPSDSDDWLNITTEELDAILTERYGPKKLYKSNGDINAEEFTKNIAEFLGKQSAFEGIERDLGDDSTDEETASSSAGRFARRADLKAKITKNNSMRKACRKNPVNLNQSINTSDADESFNTQVKSFLDFVIPEDKWDSNSEMSDYEDEDDIECNFAAMADAAKHIDSDIKAYMDQMDRELAKTTIGQSFAMSSGKKGKGETSTLAAEDDFDDIEDFEPININVNTLKNMMDSYKSQIGGAGPVSNLLNAMGVGMSVAAVCDPEDLKESAV